ncbi:DUF1127 domain-containing protein [Inquilinus limosus]|uniref:YjiS-like domain-containing protein n=1 Tax=Inquilinus limosus MP06 TaxID=1398085 RepID=A0A0A0D5C4_9PROT|nr:DUF1127 domain-containing protein [Inquilinus limosus]KGM33851.1 hypothetical protein P409_13470 [Inquilinus limosus MP06]
MSTRVVERRVSRSALSRPVAFAGWRQVFGLWLRRARTRRQLDALTDHELRDLGLDRGAALREAAKPFWRG